MNKFTILLVTLFLLAACGTQTADGTGIVFRTADPALSIGFRLVQPPVPPIEPSLLPTVTPSPECVNAKANIAADGTRIYHMPDDANYNTVKIDKDGEAIYCTAAEAESAGFRRALR